jgi:hypothetical protein
LLDHAFDSCGAQDMRDGPAQVIRQCGYTDGGIITTHFMTTPARVLNLAEQPAIMFLHGLSQPLKRWHPAID